MLEAGHFIYTIEKRQSFKVACLEEIGFHQGWISKEQLLESAEALKTEYGQYLKKFGKNQMKVETTKIEGLLILHPSVLVMTVVGLWKVLTNNALLKHLKI